MGIKILRIFLAGLFKQSFKILLTELLPKSHSGLKKCMRRVIPTPDGRLLRVGLSGDSEGRVSHTNLCTCKTIDCYTCGPVSRVDRFLEVSKMVQARTNMMVAKYFI